MSSKTSSKSTWVVVEVRSGIPVEVKAFPNPKRATEYLVSLRESLNLDNDEVGIFEINLQE